MNIMVNNRVSEFKKSKSCFLRLLFSFIFFAYLTESLLDVKNPKCVFDVGRNLTKRLTDAPSGTKEDLINDLTDYFIYLNTAFRVEDQSHPKGKQALQKLKARGGPPFLGVDVKDALLEEKYEMGAVEVDHVKEVITDIAMLWKDITHGILVPPEFENY